MPDLPERYCLTISSQFFAASGQSEDDEGPSRRTQMADVHAFGCLYQEVRRTEAR